MGNCTSLTKSSSTVEPQASSDHLAGEAVEHRTEPPTLSPQPDNQLFSASVPDASPVEQAIPLAAQPETGVAETHEHPQEQQQHQQQQPQPPSTQALCATAEGQQQSAAVLEQPDDADDDPPPPPPPPPAEPEPDPSEPSPEPAVPVPSIAGDAPAFVTQEAEVVETGSVDEATEPPAGAVFPVRQPAAEAASFAHRNEAQYHAPAGGRQTDGHGAVFTALQPADVQPGSDEEESPAPVDNPFESPGFDASEVPDIDWSGMLDRADVGGIVAVMRAHPLVSEVQLMSLELLNTYWNAALNRKLALKKLLEAPVAAATCDSMRQLLTVPRVQLAALTLLSTLCQSAQGRSQLLDELPGTATIVAAYKADTGNLDVSAAAFGCLAKLLPKRVSGQKIGRMQLVETIVDQSLVAHRENVPLVLAAFGVLRVIAETDQKKDLIGSPSGVRSILAAMRHHLDSGVVQISGCRLLKRIAHGTYSLGQSRQAVVKVATGGRGLPVALTVRGDEERFYVSAASIAENGCFEMALTILQKHESNARLARKILKLFTIVPAYNGALKSQLRETQDFENVARVLVVHKLDPKAVLRTFQLLEELVKKNEPLAEKLFRCGAASAALPAIRYHRQNEPLVVSGTSFLFELANAFGPARSQIGEIRTMVPDLLSVAESASRASDAAYCVMRLLDSLLAIDASRAKLEAERSRVQQLLKALVDSQGSREVTLAVNMADDMRIPGIG